MSEPLDLNDLEIRIDIVPAGTIVASDTKQALIEMGGRGPWQLKTN